MMQMTCVPSARMWFATLVSLRASIALLHCTTVAACTVHVHVCYYILLICKLKGRIGFKCAVLWYKIKYK